MYIVINGMTILNYLLLIDCILLLGDKKKNATSTSDKNKELRCIAVCKCKDVKVMDWTFNNKALG